MIPTVEIIEYTCDDCDYDVISEGEYEICPRCGSKNLTEYDRYPEIIEKEFEYE